MTAKFTKSKRHVQKIHASKDRITADSLGRRMNGKAAGKTAGGRSPKIAPKKKCPTCKSSKRCDRKPVVRTVRVPNGEPGFNRVKELCRNEWHQRGKVVEISSAIGGQR